MEKVPTKNQLLHKVAHYCSASERAPSEVVQKLSEWGADQETAEEITQYLIQENYINEKRYCEAFVKDKFRFNKWGRLKIGMMLKAKVSDSHAINEALTVIDETAYREVLTALLKAKLKQIKYSSDYEKKGKLMRFALSRGFESSVASHIIDSFK
jgi:regulatory protein